MLHEHHRTLRPDAKGRVTLGDLAKDVSGFRLMTDDENRIVLEPMVEIPARERWLYDNKEANQKSRASLEKGLKQAAEGKLVNLGSFQKYKDDEE
tara:strand:+ start:86890 stop:87174 length:285 start_codon:yes stop_codon:yes gene_type:complete